MDVCVRMENREKREHYIRTLQQAHAHMYIYRQTRDFVYIYFHGSHFRMKIQ